MAWGKFSGCGCCPPINVCEPKHARDGVGDVTIDSWGFRTDEVTDREDAVAKWVAYLVVSTTHAGAYRFEFEQEYTRTFHIPTVEGRSPTFWSYPKIYFSTPVTVTFMPADLVAIRVGGAFDDPLLVEDSAEDDAFREAFGGLSPWEVWLTMFPITSTIPTENPGEVEYPNAFSDFQGIPPADSNATIDDHIEVSWASARWFNYIFSQDEDVWFNWGSAAGADPLYFGTYTHHPRGYTFLPSGLGVLNEPIHQFGAVVLDWFNFSTSDQYLWDGACYPNRINAFIAPMSVTITGVDTLFDEGDPGNADLIAIVEGLNATYACEWSGLTPTGPTWQGKGDYWIVNFGYSNAIGGITTGNVLYSYPTASEATEQYSYAIHITFEPLFGHYGQSYIGLTTLNGESALVPVTDVKALPGIGWYEDGGFTHLYLTDPAAYVDAIAPLLTWAAVPDDPFGQMVWDDLSVSVSSA
jgi:hypothetical protein